MAVAPCNPTRDPRPLDPIHAVPADSLCRLVTNVGKIARQKGGLRSGAVHEEANGVRYAPPLRRSEMGPNTGLTGMATTRCAVSGSGKMRENRGKNSTTSDTIVMKCCFIIQKQYFMSLPSGLIT
jgi:hypothetical protein